MKIKLTQGKFALVDDEDFEYLNQWKWFFNNGYAVRQKHIGMINGKRKQEKVYLHREVMKTPINLYTDHINHDTLDNRKSNLRICTNQQNSANMSKPKNNTTGFKGVYRSRNKWRARIYVLKRGIGGGSYNTKEEAAKAYNLLALKYFGDFAQLNEVT